MRALLVVLCLWCVGGLLALGCVKRDPPPPLTGLEADAQTRVDGLKLPRWPDGSTWKLSSHLGHVVLLDVWATWCDPCRDSLPLYSDFSKQYAARGLDVLTVNIDADSNVIRPFVDELKLELPVLLDPKGELAESKMRVKVMPTAFLIDRQGRLRQVHEGFAGEFLARYTNEIEELLKEPAK